tara:strand:+ start:159 stop:632 length:474 start_codon:yes stop_codon:yes gene_type:complete
VKTWGIDPGLNGAIALLDSNGQTLELFDMPTLAIKKEKREIAPILIADILLTESNTRVYVERVAARPGQGVTSMFNFGKGFGMILGVIAGMQMSIHLVTPTQWKRDLKLPPGKDGSREAAMNLFPQYSDKFKRKKDDGRADAACIAFWGQRFGLEDF